MKCSSILILSVMICLIRLHIYVAAIPYTGKFDYENTVEEKNDASYGKDLKLYKRICQEVGREFDSIATNEEIMICYTSTLNEIERLYKNSNPLTLRQIGLWFENRDTFYNGSQINPDSRTILQKDIVPILCPAIKPAINWINPFKLQSLEKCTSILGSESKNLIDLQVEMAEVILESACENDGEKVLDLIDAGFIECWGQYKEHWSNCLQNYDRNIGHLGLNCGYLEIVKDCFLDIISAHLVDPVQNKPFHISTISHQILQLG